MNKTCKYVKKKKKTLLLLFDANGREPFERTSPNCDMVVKPLRSVQGLWVQIPLAYDLIKKIIKMTYNKLLGLDCES